MFYMCVHTIGESIMANPLGIVARLTRPLRDTASDYFEKFDSLMKSGNMENILSRVS
jgi:hypothetical protein